jgi:Na+-translocating ferredoxin:NAD+ oxidoreductase RnfG subunit
LAKTYLSEVEIFGIILVVISIVIVVVIALIYEKRTRKIKELKRQQKMLTARLNKWVGGRKKPRL